MYKQMSRTHYLTSVIAVFLAVLLTMLAAGVVVSAATSSSPALAAGSLRRPDSRWNGKQGLETGELARPYIGLTYQPVTPQLSQEHGLQATAGDILSQVADNSPATRAGLQPGDIITAIDGQAIDDQHPLTAALIGHAPGDTIRLQMQRGGKMSIVILTLGAVPSAGSH